MGRAGPPRGVEQALSLVADEEAGASGKSSKVWVIDPQDSTFYRYENLQLQRNDSFAHAEKGIVFDMNQLKTLLD